MLCDVEFNKDSSSNQAILESAAPILQDHHYRFVNREKQTRLAVTVYDKDKFPSHSTIRKMYKTTANNTYPILLQSVAYHCRTCNKLTAASLGGDYQNQVNITTSGHIPSYDFMQRNIMHNISLFIYFVMSLLDLLRMRFEFFV